MSLILDALKKLDREKSSRRKGAANIAVEILRPDPPRPRKRILLYFSAISVTAVAAAAITYGVMGGFGFLLKSSPPAPVNPPAPSQQVASASLESGSLRESTPAAPAKPPSPSPQVAPAPRKSGSLPRSTPPAPIKPPAPSQAVASAPPKSGTVPRSTPPVSVSPPMPSQQVPPAPLSREPVQDVRDEMGVVSPKIQKPAESMAPATSPGEKKTGPGVVSKEEEIVTRSLKKPAEPTPRASTATPPSLKISGIVWYEEASRRRAVINGQFTSEGSVIEGVKVVEIFPTRVRFSHNGRIFEISAFE